MEALKGLTTCKVALDVETQWSVAGQSNNQFCGENNSNFSAGAFETERCMLFYLSTQ